MPLAVLTQLDPAPFSWQVPGLRTELATELIRSLPKAARRQFVPAPEFAVRALAWLGDQPGPETESLPQALSRALRGLTGEIVDDGAWQPAAVPAHLQLTFLVVAEPGSTRGDRRGSGSGGLQQELARPSMPL